MRSRPPEHAPLTPLDGVPTREVRWLWPGWLPRGKITVLDGDPGLGKSTLLLDLAARVSAGRAMPDGSPGLRAGVCILSAENALTDTVRPRLEAAGADLSRVHALETVCRPGQDMGRPPALPRDLRLLEKSVRLSQSRLLIIDPFVAFLGRGVDAAQDQDVRRC